VRLVISDGIWFATSPKPNTMLAMRTLVNNIGTEMALFKDLAKVPNDKVRNFRNYMYLASARSA